MGEVTPAYHGFNIGVLILRRENLPKDRNAAIDGVIRDDAFLPNSVNQLISADDFVLMGQEVIEEFGDPGLQASGGFTVVQIADVGVEAPTTEYVSLGIVSVVYQLVRESWPLCFSYY